MQSLVFRQKVAVTESTIESEATMGYMATGLHSEQLQVVAGILGRQNVTRHYITVPFPRHNSSCAWAGYAL